jgi:hypothetical protein
MLVRKISPPGRGVFALFVLWSALGYSWKIIWHFDGRPDAITNGPVRYLSLRKALLDGTSVFARYASECIDAEPPVGDDVFSPS